jgi:hypothetical protein
MLNISSVISRTNLEVKTDVWDLRCLHHQNRRIECRNERNHVTTDGHTASSHIDPQLGPMTSGAIGVISGRENRSTQRKPAPVPLCLPQIPYDLILARTRAAAVGSRRLSAWATARPLSQHLSADSNVIDGLKLQNWTRFSRAPSSSVDHHSALSSVQITRS